MQQRKLIDAGDARHEFVLELLEMRGDELVEGLFREARKRYALGYRLGR